MGCQTRGKVWQAMFDRTRPVGSERKGSVLDSLEAGQRCLNANRETSRTQIANWINLKATEVKNSRAVVS